ncbi:MAG: hypothetical protein U0R17_00355 [Acidimicrobiia bacterium]
MNKKYTIALSLIIIGALSIFFLGYKSILNNNVPSLQVLRANTTVKPFDTKDIDGKPYVFKQQDGITIYEVFASWCLPCRKSVPETIKFSKENNIKVTGIAYRDLDFEIKKFQKKYGSFDKTILSNGKVENALKIANVPQTIFVSNDKVLYRIYGQPTAENLKEVLLLVKRELSSSN